MKKCGLFCLCCIFTLLSLQAETKRILVVGNSFSYDATLQEFLPIVKSMSDDIILGFPYKGGTTLELHWDRMQSQEVIYNYHEIKNGNMTTTGANSRAFSPAIISREPWDIVVIQTDHNYSGVYSHYFPYLNNIIDYIKANLTNHDAKFYLYMTWAYQNNSAKIIELIKKGYYLDQEDQYTKIVDCAFRAAEQSGIGTENIIPGGTAVQNGRTSYIGDEYNRDGYHMDMSHGRYTVALTWYEKLFGKSALDVPYHPATITDACADMCRHAAHYAIETPDKVTSLQDEFGVNPDTETISRHRSIRINFTTPEHTSETDGWNNLTSIAAGTKIAEMITADNTSSSISAEIVAPFGGYTTNGATKTQTGMKMPENVSSTGFWVNGVERNGVLVNEAKVKFSGLDPDLRYDLLLFGSQLDEQQSFETEFSAGEFLDFIDLDTSNNTDRTVTLKGIAPDADGNIVLSVAPGATSEDAYHMGYINAMAILLPFVPSARDPWDGETTVEPELDANGWRSVGCGAELAWVAHQVNAGLSPGNINIVSDIDLGSKPWTPIGWGGKAFNAQIEGNGHKITNLYVKRADLNANNSFAGLIGYTNSVSCSLRNLELSGVIEVPANMTAKSIIGSFIGKANALGSIENCHSDVVINVNGTPGYVGGVIGFVKNIDLRSCSFSGSININGQITHGVGGIVGTSNSGVSGVETLIHGCFFTGKIINNGSGKPRYAAGINAYSNITAGSETVTNNYVTGDIAVTATNYGVISGLVNTSNFSTADNFAKETLQQSDGAAFLPLSDFNSGRAAYLLNGDATELFFGQDLSATNNLPTVYAKENHVYRVTFIVDNKEYAVTYSNSTLSLPTPPNIENFVGWQDANGTIYHPGDVIDSDLILYAVLSSGVVSASAENVEIEVVGKRLHVKAPREIGVVEVRDVAGALVWQTVANASSVEADLSLPCGIYVASAVDKHLKFRM